MYFLDKIVPVMIPFDQLVLFQINNENRLSQQHVKKYLRVCIIHQFSAVMGYRDYRYHTRLVVSGEFEYGHYNLGIINHKSRANSYILIN